MEKKEHIVIRATLLLWPNFENNSKSSCSESLRWSKQVEEYRNRDYFFLWSFCFQFFISCFFLIKIIKNYFVTLRHLLFCLYFYTFPFIFSLYANRATNYRQKLDHRLPCPRPYSTSTCAKLPVGKI